MINNPWPNKSKDYIANPKTRLDPEINNQINRDQNQWIQLDAGIRSTGKRKDSTLTKQLDSRRDKQMIIHKDEI